MYRELIKKYPDSIKKTEKTYASPEILNSTINAENIKKECEGNDMLKKIFNDMKEYFYRYTETVFEYNEILTSGLNDEELNKKFQEINKKRTIIHNATIDSVNILSRSLMKAGKDNQWIKEVGKSRATYGKFAIINTIRDLLKEKEEEKIYE